MNRFVLNETSYHGKGAISAVADEVKARGFKKVFVASDPDLIKFGVTKKVLDVLDGAGIEYSVFSEIKPNPTIENVQAGVAAFKAAGADQIVVHVETTKHLHRCIQQIKAEGMKAGVSLNPATPLCTVEEILPYVDMVLLMSVNPGFGGQSFIESTVPKIARLRKMIDDAGLNVDIQVDGGINDKTAVLVKEAGATVLVAGSYVYGAQDVKAAIESLR